MVSAEVEPHLYCFSYLVNLLNRSLGMGKLIKCIYFGRLEVSIQLANRSIFKLYDIQNAKLIDPMESGLQETSIVKTSQILTISKMRLEKKLGQLDKEKMEAVNHAIKLSLGLDYYSIFLINIFLHFQYVN